MKKALVNIRRTKSGIVVENSVGKQIAIITDDSVMTNGYLTHAELNSIHAVVENFEIFFNNIIEE